MTELDDIIQMVCEHDKAKNKYLDSLNPSQAKRTLESYHEIIVESFLQGNFTESPSNTTGDINVGSANPQC